MPNLVPRGHRDSRVVQVLCAKWVLMINSEIVLKVIGGPQPGPFLNEPEPPCHD